MNTKHEAVIETAREILLAMIEREMFATEAVVSTQDSKNVSNYIGEQFNILTREIDRAYNSIELIKHEPQ